MEKERQDNNPTESTGAAAWSSWQSKYGGRLCHHSV